MKYNFLFLLFFLACSSIQEPLPDNPSLQVIKNFYKDYFAQKENVKIPYSQSFQDIISENKNICMKYAGSDLCGWGAGGDIFLNGQEYSLNLNFENTKFIASSQGESKVKVNFNIYPEMNNSHYDRELTFLMKNERGAWVIDDIMYENGDTAKRRIESENKSFSSQN